MGDGEDDGDATVTDAAGIAGVGRDGVRLTESLRDQGHVSADQRALKDAGDCQRSGSGQRGVVVDAAKVVGISVDLDGPSHVLFANKLGEASQGRGGSRGQGCRVGGEQDVRFEILCLPAWTWGALLGSALAMTGGAIDPG